MTRSMPLTLLSALLIAGQSAAAQPPRATARTQAAPHSADTQKRDEINAGIIGLAGGQIEGAPLRLATEIARAVDDADRLHVLPIVTRGPAENVEALLYLRGVDLAIINLDVLERFKASVPNLSSKMSYVVNLFPSEVHILARSGINSLDDLKGKKVNFNTAGTAAAYSGPLLFDRLGIEVEKTFIPHQTALEQMQDGGTDAVFFITSKPVDAFLKKRFSPGFKFLPVPYDDRLADYYLPASLTHSDYPSLIAEQQDVQTIAAPTALVAFNWPSHTDRYRRLERFVNSLFDHLERLQQPGFDVKWQSLNIAAEVPSLSRFAAAQDWINQSQARVALASSSPSASIDPTIAREQIARMPRLSPAQQEKLLREFLRWARNRN